MSVSETWRVSVFSLGEADGPGWGGMGAVKTPGGGGADTLFFLSSLLAFRFAIEGFEVLSRSRV